MTNNQLELLAQYAAMRVGCERALALLTNPNASEFDADKVIHFLTTVLKDQ